MSEAVQYEVVEYAKKGQEYPDPDVAAAALAWGYQRRSARGRLIAFGKTLFAMTVVLVTWGGGGGDEGLGVVYQDSRDAEAITKMHKGRRKPG